MNQKLIAGAVIAIFTLQGCAYPRIPNESDTQVIKLGQDNRAPNLDLVAALDLVSGWEVLYNLEADHRRIGQTVLSEEVFFGSVLAAVGTAKENLGKTKTGAVAATIGGLLMGRYKLEEQAREFDKAARRLRCFQDEALLHLAVSPGLEASFAGSTVAISPPLATAPVASAQLQVPAAPNTPATPPAPPEPVAPAASAPSVTTYTVKDVAPGSTTTYVISGLSADVDEQELKSQTLELPTIIKRNVEMVRDDLRIALAGLPLTNYNQEEISQAYETIAENQAAPPPTIVTMKGGVPDAPTATTLELQRFVLALKSASAEMTACMVKHPQ